MTCYIVSFQSDSAATRQKIRDLLKTYSIYCPINSTCWAIVTEKKATEIRDHVGEALGSEDRIFVVRSGTEAAWRNAISTKHTDWLKKNL
jgi:hypothetical protein